MRVLKAAGVGLWHTLATGLATCAVKAAGAAAAAPRPAPPGRTRTDSHSGAPRRRAARPCPGSRDASRSKSLTAEEAALLTAIAARLIPSDANGPGAVEAGAVAYIDRALAGAWPRRARPTARGLAALERYADRHAAQPFRELAPVDQDSLLIDVETGAATGSGAGFDGSSAAFFALRPRPHVAGHVRRPVLRRQPRATSAGSWLGIPACGRTSRADDQRLGVVPPPLRRSAYDSDMFTKATARLDRRGPHHGDPA